MHGTIVRRLLVNAVADPAEVAGRLPNGLRPHVTDGGTVVGCCLLEVEHLRPAAVPAALGTGLRAAAHRISVEWDHEHGTAVGVYVPVRHADSLLARALGGRWFPGVHRPAAIEVVEDGTRLRWTVEARGGTRPYGVRVEASVPPSDAAEIGGPIGRTCLSAAIGLSWDHHGRLEAARMEPDHRAARRVEVAHLHSAFLAGFASTRPAPSYLMPEVPVTWTPAHTSRLAAREVLA